MIVLPLKSKHSFLKPKKIIDEPTIHSKKLIKSVKENTFFNPDSPNYEKVYEFAMLAVNAAINAQEIQGFSICEPPGHHAGIDFLGGFCYFNNIAEAVIQSKLKTLIIDIDGHHGNGTQNIFENNKDVFFISLHSSPNYPGTGLSSKNNILNCPLSRDCGEEIYLKTLKEAIKQALKKFLPEQIAVSAGFDTYMSDLASLGLKKNSYEKIAKIIKDTKDKINSKIFIVLEGGYSKELGELIHEFIRGFKD